MNVLIIGLGSIARKHITALKSLNFDSKIYALRSILNATIEEGVEHIYDIRGHFVDPHWEFSEQLDDLIVNVWLCKLSQNLLVPELFQ